MTVELLKSTVPYGANTYKVVSGEEYLIIDPAVPPKKDVTPPKYVLLTHAHFDHILFVEEWASLGCEVLISEKEADKLSDPGYNCYRQFFGKEDGYFGKVRGISSGEVITFGADEICYINTPGHTEGSGIYLCGDICFVGDTVFAGGGFGRYDLPSGNFSRLRESIRKILSLPEETVLYPGHGEKTTVKEYKGYLKL